MEKNKFFELIRNRRSIRAYDPDRKVPEDVFERILLAGQLAPTAGNRQPVTCHLVGKGPVLDELRKCYGRNWFKMAPSVLVVTGKREDAWSNREDGFNALEIDAAIVMDHMILAAESEGVSTCWIIAFDPGVVRKALKLPQDEEPLIMTPLGYFPEGYEKREMPERKPLDELVKRY